MYRYREAGLPRVNIFKKYIYIFVTLFYSVLVIAFAFAPLGLAARIKKRITPLCLILSEED